MVTATNVMICVVHHIKIQGTMRFFSQYLLLSRTLEPGNSSLTLLRVKSEIRAASLEALLAVCLRWSPIVACSLPGLSQLLSWLKERLLSRVESRPPAQDSNPDL